MTELRESNVSTQDHGSECHLATSPAVSSATKGNAQDLPSLDKDDNKVRIDSVCSSQATTQASTNGRSWKLTIIRFGPLSGLCCLCLAVASIAAAFGVLVGSSNSPVKSWTVEPSAYLALCTAIANQSMRYACFQGVAIAWWFRASRGSTLARLHHDWRSGTTIRGALTAGRHMGLLGLACIFSTLVAIDGPLLQRASTVVPSAITGSVELNVTMAMEVPSGFTGGWERSGDGQNIARLSSSFNDTIPAANGTNSNHIISEAVVDADGDWSGKWYSEGIMFDFIEGCPGTCKATIRAPALAQTYCSSTIIPVNYFDPVNLKGELSENVAPPLNTDAFLISHSLQVDSELESINLLTASTANVNCSGILNITACSIVSAIGDYDVEIQNNTVSLSSLSEPRIVALANNTQVQPFDEQRQNHPSTLAGISYLGSLKWDSGVSYFSVDGTVHTLSALEYGDGAFVGYRRGSVDSYCWNFTNPRDDIMKNLNELMFLTGWFAPRVFVPSWSNLPSDFADLEDKMDPGLPVNVTIKGEKVGEENHFHVDFAWFFGAVAVELICIILVLPTYWGWWRLGRPVSFSPLEIAKAFEAPLLSDCSSNSSGRDIAKSGRNVLVQYGATTVGTVQEEFTNDQGKKLAFGSKGFVSPPRRDTHFEV